MRFTRRQVLKLAAAQGVLLSLPRTATAAARLVPGDGFAGAARWGEHLAVASAHRAGSRIDFYSPNSGVRTRSTVAVPSPLVLGAIAAIDGSLHVGGHVLVEGPPVYVAAGDDRKVFADSGDSTDLEGDGARRRRIAVRDYRLVPWTASMTAADSVLGEPVRWEARRGVVRGFTPNGGEPTVWIAECPEAATFSATAVRAWRGPDGPEITSLSLATGDVDVSSLLAASDGTTAVLSSNDHGLARVWQIHGEEITELRLPDESVPRVVLQLLVSGSGYHVITADLEDGAVRQWVGSGSRWSQAATDRRNLVPAGDLDLELPNP